MIFLLNIGIPHPSLENDARSEVVAEMGAGSVVVHCKSQGKQTSACLSN